MRTYGDSLDKFEPNDLNASAVPTPEAFGYLSKKEIEFGLKYVKQTGELPVKLEAKFGALVQMPKKDGRFNELPRASHL